MFCFPKVLFLEQQTVTPIFTPTWACVNGFILHTQLSTWATENASVETQGQGLFSILELVLKTLASYPEKLFLCLYVVEQCWVLVQLPLETPGTPIGVPILVVILTCWKDFFPSKKSNSCILKYYYLQFSFFIRTYLYNNLVQRSDNIYHWSEAQPHIEVSIKKLLNWSRSQDCSSQPPCWGTSEHHRAQLKSTQPGPGTLNTVEAQVSHNESFFCNFPSVMRCCRSKIPAGLYCCFTLIEGSFS